MFSKNNNLLIALFIICILSRVLTSIYYVEDIDSLRFSLSIIDYDITKLQPHFPGYPIFCFFVKVIHFFTGNMGISFSIIGGLSTFFIIYYSLRIFNTGLKSYEGAYIALLIFLNPLFWLMSNRYMPDLMGLAISLSAINYLIYSQRHGKHLEKGFFLSGLLAGIRLSYFPLVFLPLIKIFHSSDKKRSVLIKYFLFGTSIWFLPMVFITGPSDLLLMAKKQTTGHFMDFGGTIFTDKSMYDRILLLFRSVWADGFGGYWTSRGPTSILLSAALIAQLFIGTKDVFKKWNSENKIRPFILCAVVYFVWILLFQNVIYKSRHVLPLILFLCILMIEGQEKYRGKIYSSIIYLFFAVLLMHNVTLIKQHRGFTAVQKLKNHISKNDNIGTVVSIPLINFYLQSHQLKINYIDVENFEDINSLSLESSNTKDILMVGDYRNLFSSLSFNFYSDKTFYHNPYMNQMWSKIKTYRMQEIRNE